MMQGDPFRVDIILFMLSVGSRYARTHGYYKGNAFGVINHMHKIICEKISRNSCESGFFALTLRDKDK